MSASRTHPLRFGPFEMNLSASELFKNGVRMRLQPQPFKVLALLATRPGEVITRPIIEKEIWGEGTHVDFEVGLNYCIRQIRLALDDNAETPIYIETLAKRGYRFLASVEREDRIRPGKGHRLTLAVIPFGNLTNDTEQEYLADGMTEELIMQLGRLSPDQLRVIAFTTSKRYKNTPKGIDQIGEELNVDYILEGSIRRARDRVRIAAQLIQVSDQCHLWAEAYNRTLDDIITVQTDVAERVAHSLMLELLPDHKAEMAKGATRDSVAYEAYLKGRYYWDKRTEDAFWKALKYFQAAIDREPEYAPAYVGMADTYGIAAYYSGLPPKQANEKFQAAIGKALTLDPGFAEAYSSRGWGQLIFDWDFSGAEKTFRRALDLNANHVTGHSWYAICLAAMSRFDEALRQIDLALELDPLSLAINSIKGWILYLAHRFREAAEQLTNTIEMDVNFALSHYYLGLVYIQLAQYKDSVAQFAKAREASNEHPAAISGFATGLGLAGDMKQASRVLADFEELATRRYVEPYYLAAAHLNLGNKAQGFRWLEKGFEERSPRLSKVMVDPAFDKIRSDARFTKLLRSAGLK